MTYRVVLQPSAEREIREAARFLADAARSTTPAIRWVRQLRAKIETLQVHPERCPVDPDSVVYEREVRVLLFGKRSGIHRILFTVDADAVHVLSVGHAARRSLLEEADDE